MKTIVGIIGMIAGIFLGLYVGFWVCLAGGIIGLCHAFVALVAGKVLGTLIALSVVKIAGAGFLGWLSFAVLFLPSWALVVSDN
jgi:hypothetical protein